MGGAHKPLATMRERNGRVRDWLADMDRHQISKLISRLKDEAEAEAAK